MISDKILGYIQEDDADQFMLESRFEENLYIREVLHKVYECNAFRIYDRLIKEGFKNNERLFDDTEYENSFGETTNAYGKVKKFTVLSYTLRKKQYSFLTRSICQGAPLEFIRVGHEDKFRLPNDTKTTQFQLHLNLLGIIFEGFRYTNEHIYFYHTDLDELEKLYQLLELIKKIHSIDDDSYIIKELQHIPTKTTLKYSISDYKRELGIAKIRFNQMYLDKEDHLRRNNLIRQLLNVF
ncbi:hypothetical protein [Paenibacillus sp. MMO-177]|uniref:hypothetical protein n=1 Tax=Paenibacillus sp. MMO-177 TaxID=3081289 RepID=UPI00301B52A1